VWLDDYTAASLIASAIIVIPLFYAKMYVAWRVVSRRNLRSQELVFWVVTTSGASLTTQFTAVLFAQLLSLSVVWVGRDLTLDRWIFKFQDGRLALRGRVRPKASARVRAV